MDAMMTCKHIKAKLPAWQSEDKHAIADMMMADNPADLMRELKGVQIEDTGACFAKTKVNATFNLPTIEVISEHVDYLYVSMDPNSGQHDESETNTSDFALISAVDVLNRGLIVLGAEAIPAREPEDFMPQVAKHLQALREKYLTAIIVIIIENNLGQDAGFIRKYINDLVINNVVFMNETDLKTGVRTTANTKKEMMISLRQLIDKQQVFFAKDMINPQLIPILKDQVLRYSKVKKPPTTPLGMTRVAFNGLFVS
jgi:hypothetical protein